MEPIILASSSPRRQELMRQLGFPITVMSVKADESLPEGVPVKDAVAVIAKRKVELALALTTDRFMPWVLGADTLIEINGKVLGKPVDRAEAQAMLESLSGTWHEVHTGLCLACGKDGSIRTLSTSTKVFFRSLKPAEVEWYLDTGEWQGVAGGYRIQGKAGFFAERVEGQYQTVVGLPISSLYGILTDAGYIF